MYLLTRQSRRPEDNPRPDAGGIGAVLPLLKRERTNGREIVVMGRDKRPRRGVFNLPLPSCDDAAE